MGNIVDFDSLKQLFDMHIKECDARDVRNAKSFESMTSMVKGIWDTMDNNKEADSKERAAMKNDITNINLRIAYALGGLVVILWLLDHAVTFLGHK